MKIVGLRQNANILYITYLQKSVKINISFGFWKGKGIKVFSMRLSNPLSMDNILVVYLKNGVKYRSFLVDSLSFFSSELSSETVRNY